MYIYIYIDDVYKNAEAILPHDIHLEAFPLYQYHSSQIQKPLVDMLWWK